MDEDLYSKGVSNISSMKFACSIRVEEVIVEHPLEDVLEDKGKDLKDLCVVGSRRLEAMKYTYNG